MSKEVSYKVADMADPATHRMIGCRREGKNVVTDDDDAVVIHELTEDELKRAIEFEKK